MKTSNAEEEGFEPSDPVSQVNSLAVSPIRPLSHLSSLALVCQRRTLCLSLTLASRAGQHTRRPAARLPGEGQRFQLSKPRFVPVTVECGRRLGVKPSFP